MRCLRLRARRSFARAPALRRTFHPRVESRALAPRRALRVLTAKAIAVCASCIFERCNGALETLPAKIDFDTVIDLARVLRCNLASIRYSGSTAMHAFASFAASSAQSHAVYCCSFGSKSFKISGMVIRGVPAPLHWR